MKSSEVDKRVEEWISLVPEYGFSHAFVLSEEAASFRLVTELGIVNAKTILNASRTIEDEIGRERIENGGLFSWLFRLDQLAETVTPLVPAIPSMPRFAVGGSWLASYNAGCWLMPNGECAIIVDTFMLVCLFAFSDILIRNSGHVYVDIGFHDDNGRLEDDILAERARACAHEFADYFDRMVGSYPPLDFVVELHTATKAPSTKGLTAWHMGQGFLQVIVGHELGHASQAHSAQMHASAIPLAVSTLDRSGVQHDREFQADTFAYNMYKKLSGRIVYFDYFFRLSAVYLFAISGLTRLLPTYTHPHIPARFGNVVQNAVDDGVIEPHAANNIIANYNLWVSTVLDTLRNDPARRLDKWRRSWLAWR